jgi:hypothetical protein
MYSPYLTYSGDYGDGYRCGYQDAKDGNLRILLGSAEFSAGYRARFHQYECGTPSSE